MKIIECEQGSPEWDRVRGVIPTASMFSKILTPTGKPSTQAGAYMDELLSHWLMGHGDLGEGFTSPWMEHGRELEDTAIAFYELTEDVEVNRAGFCLTDDERAGCSPDGLVGDAGGIEIKCPKGSTHVAYLRGQKIPTTHIPQVQGSMFITDRPWWDFMSFHSEMSPMIIRVYRDYEYISKLRMALDVFFEKMIEKRTTLMELGYAPQNI